MGLYDISVKDMKNADVSMKTFEGKVLLIVNTATGCGFTPQYDGLEKLYANYKDKGFAVLDFPCNQFAGQAPDNIEKIDAFCTLKYHTTFPRFAKIEVNGDHAKPNRNVREGDRIRISVNGQQAIDTPVVTAETAWATAIENKMQSVTRNQ